MTAAAVAEFYDACTRS